MVSLWPCSKLIRAHHPSQNPSCVCPAATAHRLHSLNWLIRIRCRGLAPNPSRIPYTGGCKLIGMRGSNGLFLCRLPCIGLGILVGFTKRSLSKAWGKGLCVSGDSPGRRRPCIGSSSNQSMVEIWKFTGRRRRKEKIGPHHPEQGVLNLHLALPLWNPNFQRPTHIYQRIHTNVHQLATHSGPAVPRMRIMWWKLPKWFHEILLVLYVGRSCKRTTFDPILYVDNRNLRQASPTIGTAPPSCGAQLWLCQYTV